MASYMATQAEGEGRALEKAIGSRLKFLRQAAGMSLGDLAQRSGVSKAMIARVERAESSATGALLGKLCAGLGVTLSSVLVLAERPPERLSLRSDQPTWRDPETGYKRRHVSPPGAASGVEIIEVDLPPGVRVPYSPWGTHAYTTQLVMLAGRLRVWIGDKDYDLHTGDCLDFDVMRSVIFENEVDAAARYLIFVRNR
jgi:transcriptional regulator with XRE-family HTH domain